MEEVTSNTTIAAMMVNLTCHEVVFLYDILDLPVCLWCASFPPPRHSETTCPSKIVCGKRSKQEARSKRPAAVVYR